MAEIRVKSLAGLQQQVIAPPHSYISDEPPAFDGDDLGPDPYEQLLAALGCCTNMTLLMYARRKGWPLEGVDTVLNNDRVYGDDCSRCEEDIEYLDRIERRITLHGDLARDQVQALARVAGKCPVHKTLTRGIVVEDVIVVV